MRCQHLNLLANGIGAWPFSITQSNSLKNAVKLKLTSSVKIKISITRGLTFFQLYVVSIYLIIIEKVNVKLSILRNNIARKKKLFAQLKNIYF